MNKVKNLFFRHYTNFKGVRANRQILVIESDDWGCIRTPNQQTLDQLKRVGLLRGQNHYVYKDNLADTRDLNALFEVLAKHQDHLGNVAVLTANFLTQNPDFQEIKKHKFEKYIGEPIKQYLEKNENEKYRACYKLWLEGMERKVFYPQLHGREHLDTISWIQALQNKEIDVLKAFELGVYGLDFNYNKSKKHFLAAFNHSGEEYKIIFLEILKEAVKQFEQLFKMPSYSFIAPNYTWSTNLECALHELGIEHIQGSRVQQVPQKNKRAIKRHYTGEQNILGQHYFVRNCFFEPSSNLKKNWAESCLQEIRTAFLWNRPAIISCHRVNFVSSLDANNASNSLDTLDNLLTLVKKQFPEVEFMSTASLGQHYQQEIFNIY